MKNEDIPSLDESTTINTLEKLLDDLATKTKNHEITWNDRGGYLSCNPGRFHIQLWPTQINIYKLGVLEVCFALNRTHYERIYKLVDSIDEQVNKVLDELLKELRKNEPVWASKSSNTEAIFGDII